MEGTYLFIYSRMFLQIEVKCRVIQFLDIYDTFQNKSDTWAGISAISFVSRTTLNNRTLIVIDAVFSTL